MKTETKVTRDQWGQPYFPVEMQVGDMVPVKSGFVGENYMFRIASISYDEFAKDFQVSGNSYGPRWMHEVAVVRRGY